MFQGKELGSTIDIFIDKETGEPLRDKKIMDNIISEVEKYGSDVWLSSDASKFLIDSKEYSKYEIVKDILDVWFVRIYSCFRFRKQAKVASRPILEGTDR